MMNDHSTQAHYESMAMTHHAHHVESVCIP
jgi:hypothetical protein